MTTVAHDGAATKRTVSRFGRFVRSTMRMAILILAFVGIGAFMGTFWLVEALEGMVPKRPSVQFLTDGASVHRRTVDRIGPLTMDAIAVELSASPIRDFDSFVYELQSHLDAMAHAQLIVIVRDAARRGDRLAMRIADAFARRSCADMRMLAGAPANADAPAACADAVLAAIRADTAEQQIPADALRLSQFAALIEAEIASPSIIASFCDGAESGGALPPRFREYIMEIARIRCIPPSPDGGTPTPTPSPTSL